MRNFNKMSMRNQTTHFFKTGNLNFQQNKKKFGTGNNQLHSKLVNSCLTATFTWRHLSLHALEGVNKNHRFMPQVYDCHSLVACVSRSPSKHTEVATPRSRHGWFWLKEWFQAWVWAWELRRSKLNAITHTHAPNPKSPSMLASSVARSFMLVVTLAKQRRREMETHDFSHFWYFK